DDFVAWIRQEQVPDPTSAPVRVMTIHGAKGLQFDAVVLPELDCGLLDRRPPAFVVDRDPETLEVTFVCRYLNETVQALLAPEERRAFARDRRQRVEEALSLLYVALTRAIHGLYLFIPGPRVSNADPKHGWHHLLYTTLAAGAPWTEHATLFETGTQTWYEQLVPAAAKQPSAAVSLQVPLPRPGAGRRRGLELAAPSQREGAARVATDHLFQGSEGTGLGAGTLLHAWLEAVGWLDDGLPNADDLRRLAWKKRHDLPAETYADLEHWLAQFLHGLTVPTLAAVLRRSAYQGPNAPGFPRSLAACWGPGWAPLRLERERRFVVRDGDKLWNGSFDRVVWLAEGGRITAADVLDFKTDALEPHNLRGLRERSEYYRPQLESYQRAAALLARLPPERVAARLVFFFAGQVVEI
ncbi:MAG: PD-(D/E)XK nuclease family protein, partial [Gemmataceae bacterium]|nr:PD-(D/E)XK nuclease family protein [Gemmataceae bacterium]